MTTGRKRISSVAAALAGAALVLTACGGADSDADTGADSAASTPTPASAAAAAPKAAAAVEAARVGAAGSGCELPITFGIPAKHKPKAVTVAADDPLAELARKGSFTMACEIDAKPAGNIGFVRVWTGKPGELRAALQGFIGAKAIEPAFAPEQIGGLPGMEVVYQQKSQLDDAIEKEQAFAVDTGKGVVVVSLDSFDSGEHTAMLPAYLLAKQTLKPAS